MEWFWFCLVWMVLLVVGLILFALRSNAKRLDSLEKQSQTQAELIKQLQLSNPSAEAEPLPAKAEPEATSVPPVLGALPAPAEGVDPLPTIEPEPQPKEPPVLEEPKPLPAIGSAPSAPTTRQGKSQPWKPLPVLPEIEPEPVPDTISEPEPVPEVATTATEPEPKTKSSFELQIGKVWLVRLGVVLVLTGLVHLARMGYEGITDEVRPYVNASLLYLVSFGMMAAGLFLHRRFEVLKNYSEVLTGGGMAAVYFSTYALYFVERPYLGLIESPVLAGVLLIAWAAFIITLATRRQSEVMAMFAIAGAYFASYIPLIHDSGGDHAIFTLFSNVALAIAATVFVIRNRWANVSFLSLFTTFAGFAYWRFVHPAGSGAEFWQGAGFLTAYWIIFTLAGFLSRHEQMTATQRSAFINLNNGAFFALMTITLLQVEVLRDQYWMLPMAFGPVLFGLFVMAKKWLPEEKLFSDVLLAKAATLPDVVAGALNVARSYLNPRKIEAIKQLKKGLGLLLTTTGGLAVLWGIMVSLGVGASMWASIVTFFAGTGIPVLGPIAIAAGIAAIAAGLYVAIKATSAESLSASAHDAIVKSVNAWAKPNEANAASEDAITALQAGSNI
mgnify:CR=1 FL=1